jgi:hypothetical protein
VYEQTEAAARGYERYLREEIRRVSLRVVTMPIQSQGIITKDNVSIDVSAVAYYRVEDPIRSVIAIENIEAAIGQIAQTTLRSVVGRHTLDELLSETEGFNQNSREILDVQTEEWGVKVTVVELRDIQLPDSMQRAMARQAEAEREKRAKIIAAEGEALAAGELGQAADVMAAHPLALQLRNLQTLVEVASRPHRATRTPKTEPSPRRDRAGSSQTPYALTQTCPVDTSTTPRAQTSIAFTHESSGWLVIRETCSRSWKTGEPSCAIATPPASSAIFFPSSVVISP